MKNKKLIALAAALMLSLQAGYTTNITGVEGVGGVYDINPTALKDTTGFRHYKDFDLSQGDVANLILKYGSKNIGTFVNLVDNQVNIQGIVNTMRNGQFSPGHAVFVSPNGMVVGASGVLNVGSLSVFTPTDANYKKYVQNPTNFSYTENPQDTTSDILIKGKVLSRGDINLQGANVIMHEGSAIVNGINSSVLILSRQQADNIFNNIVNTGSLTGTASFANKDGKIVIRTNSADGMLNIRGDIVNGNKGDIRFINEQGKNGIKITGDVESAKAGNILVENKAGKVLVKGDLTNEKGNITINSNGTGVHINSGSEIVAKNGNVRIVNTGKEGTAIYGNITNNGITYIKNNKGKLYIAGDIQHAGNKAFQIINSDKNSNTMIAKTSQIESTNDVYIKNLSKGGLFINGQIAADKDVTLDNRAGVLTINNDIASEGGNINVSNIGDKLAVSSKSTLSTEKDGSVILRNTGKDGLHMFGNAENENGIISITSSNGNLVVNGSAKTKGGNIGIVNEGNMLKINHDAEITNETCLTNIINTGKGGMKEYATVNAGSGELEIFNDNGFMYVDGNISSNGGDVSVLSRRDSSGMYIKKDANISNRPADLKTVEDIGTVTIKDTGKAGGSGLIIKGDVESANDLNIKSENNNVYVSGNLTSGNDIVIRSNAKDGKITLTKSSNVGYANSINIAPKNGTVLNDRSKKGHIVYPLPEKEAIKVEDDEIDEVVIYPPDFSDVVLVEDGIIVEAK